MKRKTNLYALLLGLAGILGGATACARAKDYPAPPPYIQHPAGEFPITASYAFYRPYISDRQMEWVKEAGFNSTMAQVSPADTDSILALADRHGMYVLASPWGIRDIRHTEEMVNRYKDNPRIWTFVMWDEPNASQFGELKELRDAVMANTDRQNVFMNLLPAINPKLIGSPDYRTYVEDFVTTVNPPFISLDIYPVKKNRQGKIYVEPILYTTMEVIREVSAESGRPFWSFILSTGHVDYPRPKEDYIRFSVFTALAYGAQGLTYYTYLMPDFDRDKGDYSYAPIGWDGERTETWEMVRNVNREVQNLADVFLGAEAVDVTQTGARIPEGTKRNYRVPAPFRGIESYGEGVTVSHLRNGDSEYLLLVNRDVQKNQKVRLSRTRPVTRIFGDGSRQQEAKETLTLSPGGFALYSLTN